MIPEPIAPYNSGLVVLFNASLLIIFLPDLLCDVLCSSRRGLWMCPLLLTRLVRFAATCITRVCPPWIYLGDYLYQIGAGYPSIVSSIFPKSKAFARTGKRGCPRNSGLEPLLKGLCATGQKEEARSACTRLTSASGGQRALGTADQYPFA